MGDLCICSHIVTHFCKGSSIFEVTNKQQKLLQTLIDGKLLLFVTWVEVVQMEEVLFEVMTAMVDWCLYKVGVCI
jgi:hypothetical protein